MDALDEAAFQQLTELLYDTVTDDGAWSRVMELVRAQFGIAGGAVAFLDNANNTQRLLYGDCPPEYGALFVDEALQNPLEPPIFYGAVGDVFIDQMLLSRQQLERGTFFNEWLRPLDKHSMLNVALWRNGPIGVHFSVLRGGRQEPFDAADIVRLNRMLPVMQRAVRLRVRFGASRLQELADSHDRNGIGLLMVDEGGLLLGSNAAAEAFIADAGSELGVANGRLRAGGPGRERLRQAIRAACTDGYDESLTRLGDMLLTERTTGRGLAALSVLPLRDAPLNGMPTARAALVLVQRLDGGPPRDLTQRLRNLFALTARESELAHSLALGHSVQDFADSARISLPTARSHLAALFRKTETTRQGELVALVHRISRPS